METTQYDVLRYIYKTNIADIVQNYLSYCPCKKSTQEDYKSPTSKQIRQILGEGKY